MTANTQKLQTVQAMRGFAAALIVILHAFHEAKLDHPAFSFRVGVEIFFVISGFVMVYASQGLFGNPEAWKQFMLRRVIRIVPLCWVYMTLLLAVAVIMPAELETPRPELLHILLSYLFIPHHSPTGGMHPFLDVTWTINYEMYFYVVFAALLFLPMRKMLFALTAFFVGAVTIGIFIPDDDHMLFFWTRPILLEFVGGVWVGYAFVTGKRLPDYAFIVLFLLALALMFVEYNPLEERPINLQVAGILFVMAAILPVSMENLKVPRWLLAGGDASYSIYLSHPFTLAALALLLRHFLKPWPLFALSVPVSLLLGYILYLLVEKPLLAAVKSVFSRS